MYFINPGVLTNFPFQVNTLIDTTVCEYLDLEINGNDLGVFWWLTETGDAATHGLTING